MRLCVRVRGTECGVVSPPAHLQEDLTRSASTSTMHLAYEALAQLKSVAPLNLEVAEYENLRYHDDVFIPAESSDPIPNHEQIRVLRMLKPLSPRSLAMFPYPSSICISHPQSQQPHFPPYFAAFTPFTCPEALDILQPLHFTRYVRVSSKQ